MTKSAPARRPFVRRLCLAALCFSACAATAQAQSPAEIAAIPDVRHVTGANTGFAFRLLRRLIQDRPAGNVFLSPLGVSEALTMTLNGAGAQTQTDMVRTLGLWPSDMGRVNHASGLLLSSLAVADPDAKIAVANALWANKDITLAPDFVAECHGDYNAQATTLDLGLPAAAETINGWAAQSTQGKITHLVTPGDIAGSSVVLTDAVYFHGRWRTPFNPASTQDAPFQVDGGRTTTVPLMRQAGSLLYGETPQYQAVGLPYGDGRVSLYVFLPQPGVTVETVTNGLTAHLWETDIAAMKPTSLTLSLPRFGAKSETRLRKPLCDLGMASAFRGGADFGPMGLSDGSLSDVIHQAVVTVDEEGTEAAAGTGAMMDRGITMSPRVMRVDRPFLMAIRDNVTGTVLFAGVIRDPQ